MIILKLYIVYRFASHNVDMVIAYSLLSFVISDVKNPFKRLPVLEVDGKVFIESVAIESYLALTFGRSSSCKIAITILNK